MNSPQPTLAASIAARLLVAPAVCLLAGCIILPVPEYDAAGSRGNLSKESVEQFQPGITNREEVILRLGEPDYATEDGRQIGYEWIRVKGWWFVGGGYTGYGGEVRRSYLLRLTFDDGGRLTGSGLLKGWGGGVSPERVARTE